MKKYTIKNLQKLLDNKHILTFVYNGMLIKVLPRFKYDNNLLRDANLVYINGISQELLAETNKKLYDKWRGEPINEFKEYFLQLIWREFSREDQNKSWERNNNDELSLSRYLINIEKAEPKYNEYEVIFENRNQTSSHKVLELNEERACEFIKTFNHAGVKVKQAKILRKSKNPLIL